MNRVEAYKLLAARLEELRGGGYDALVTHVGRPAVSETVRVDGEDVVVEVIVSWADQRRGILRVCATALGPSTWRTERLDECFEIGPN